uniref:Glucose-6-phosphate 1-dehydrogenase, cytoplasmic isoform n=1 Tax=Arundo donax TaxID=35708 RepID=A0A0A8YD13_ARUDO
MGCVTKMSKFLRHMNASSWIRMCHPFHFSKISLSFTKKFAHPVIADNSANIVSLCSYNLKFVLYKNNNTK